MSAKDNDFNWVDALNNCSVAREFEALKQTVEANVEERLRQVGAVSNIAPSFQNRSEKEFVVIPAFAIESRCVPSPRQLYLR